jgi:hypothetical protein
MNGVDAVYTTYSLLAGNVFLSGLRSQPRGMPEKTQVERTV